MGRKSAILVFIEKYHDLSPVTYAENDAMELEATLQKHGFETEVFGNANATKALIKSRLKNHTSKLEDDETFFFFYAGHGFSKNGENYITCWDTQRNDLPGTSIRLSDIFGLLRESASSRVAVFLDSCSSGLEFSDQARDIYSDLSDQELEAFFDDAEYYFCFSSCKADQTSSGSPSLQHGIWTYHLIQALAGNAPQAIVKDGFITVDSLQNFLALEVPRTVRQDSSKPTPQTPWLFGAADRAASIVNVQHLIEKRKKTITPTMKQVVRVIFTSSESVSIRSLSGFMKGHHVPDRISSATIDFVERVSKNEIEEDIEKMHQKLKDAFDLKRKDISASADPGGGSIITPYFDYECGIQQEEEDPSQAVLYRTVCRIREPNIVITDEFNEVFESMFDTLELTTTGDKTDIQDLIDRIEEIDSDQIYVDYPADNSYCEISLQGVEGKIIVEGNTFKINNKWAKDPKALVEALFESQKLLAETHKLKMLGPGGDEEEHEEK